jgi:hypothetical protein
MKMEESAMELMSAINAVYWKDLKEVENGYYEYIIEEDPAPKPRVVLPVMTKGIINISTVEQLQDKLDKTKAEVRELQIRMDAAEARERKYLEVRTELRELKEKVAADSARERKELEAQMEERLNIRSDKMKAALNAKLADVRAKSHTLAWGGLSGEEALQMLDSHPMLSAKMREAVEAARAEDTMKLESLFQKRVEMAKKQLSAIEIRELLVTNTLLQDIFKGNLSKKRAEVTAPFTTEFEAKLQSAQDAANLVKEQAVLLEGKKSALRINMM